MARLASFSFSVTMFCRAAPSAVSMATEYSSSTEMSCESTPRMPRIVPRLTSFITALTLPE